MDKLNYYKKLSKDLESLNAIILRGITGDPIDLDIFVHKKDLEKITAYLIKNYFTKTKETDFFIYFKKLTRENLFFVDITLDFKYIFSNFQNVYFNEDFVVEYLKNPEKHRVAFNTIRYLLLFRNQEKYQAFFCENKNEIIKNNFYLSNIKNNPFKDEIDFNELFDILNRKQFTLIKYLGLKNYLGLTINMKINKIKEYKKGQLTGIIGVDGIGKTTIIDIFCEYYKSKKVYMGLGTFKLKKIYDFVTSNHNFRFLKLILKLLIYLENHLRMLVCLYFKYRGHVVLIDRHPFYDHLGSKFSGHYIFDSIFYGFFFIKPDKIIILYNTPDVILQRKKERTSDEIDYFYTSIFNKTKYKRNVFKIKNDNLENTLQEMEKIIFEEC